MCSPREDTSLSLPSLTCAAAPAAGGTWQLWPSQSHSSGARSPCLSRSQKANRQRGSCFKGFGRERMEVSGTRIKKYKRNKLNFGFRIHHWRKQSQELCFVARTVGTWKGERQLRRGSELISLHNNLHLQMWQPFHPPGPSCRAQACPGFHGHEERHGKSVHFNMQKRK